MKQYNILKGLENHFELLGIKSVVNILPNN